VEFESLVFQCLTNTDLYVVLMKSMVAIGGSAITKMCSKQCIVMYIYLSKCLCTVFKTMHYHQMGHFISIIKSVLKI
jgi:hypothetical protein